MLLFSDDFVYVPSAPPFHAGENWDSFGIFAFALVFSPTYESLRKKKIKYVGNEVI
jgi:hypothetical protein